MIWPFKKREVLTVEEYAAMQPVAPCGDQSEHYRWKLQGYPCPICIGNKQRAEKDAEESRMAEKIAAAVARKLKDAS